MKTTETNQPRRNLATAAAAAISLLLVASVVRAEITLKGRVVSTPAHVITIGDSGLPAQIEIRLADREIPLAWRGQKNLSEAQLRRLGRGPQLAQPVRLEAVINGTKVVAKVETPAEIKQTANIVIAAANWKADAVSGSLRLGHSSEGAVTGQIAFDPGDARLSRLDLVLEFSGPVDTAIAGDLVVSKDGKPLPTAYGTLAQEPGLLWSNGDDPEGDGAAHPGMVQHFFLGNGDRGFTWLSHGTKGFVIGGEPPAMSVERTRGGNTIWRIALVNLPAKAGERTVGFTLLTHPARQKASNQRVNQWQPWPDAAPHPALEAGARGKLEGDLVRADSATVHEAAVARALLVVPAGGDSLTIKASLADSFPIGLFRYLSASHTALAAQLRLNAAPLTSVGAKRESNRIALGRALLHDIGLDIKSLSSPIESASALLALEQFGIFIDDGQTEFLPYWRTGGILRYGEPIKTGKPSALEFAEENPSARTRVSAFIRPIKRPTEDQIRRKTLFIIVNDGDKPVRELLYLQKPKYLFNAPNRLTISTIYRHLDFSRIPADSDWGQKRVLSAEPEGDPLSTSMERSRGTASGMAINMPAEQLMDLETGGYVRQLKIRERKDWDKGTKELEVYGPVYVPARGMRLLYGEGAFSVEALQSYQKIKARSGRALK
ncbi:MAG: hypothetical protein QF473_32555 [Planctomycetota bacterium]|jgi:hypothetical protein|nr:hypothetical protein [Planctomycetota bacterium]